jgi:glycosyltransferase involved in cell wall biosynthesis
MTQAPSLSVVLPVYNESEAIVPVLEELAQVLEKAWPGAWEVLAVDDGSSDDTADRIRQVAQTFPSIRLVSLASNVGQSGALWMGFREARAEWIATLDADGQNDPADLKGLWDMLGEADAAFGFRANRKDTRSKRWGSKLANGFRNRVLKEDIVDTGCAIKIFRKSLTDRLTPWNGMHRFLGSLFAMQGAQIVQQAVHHRPRTAGTSKYTNFGRLKKTIWDLFAVRWLRSRYVHVQLKK